MYPIILSERQPITSPTTYLQRLPFWGPTITYGYLLATTTCQQRPQISGPEGGRCKKTLFTILRAKDTKILLIWLKEKFCEFQLFLQKTGVFPFSSINRWNVREELDDSQSQMNLHDHSLLQQRNVSKKKLFFYSDKNRRKNYYSKALYTMWHKFVHCFLLAKMPNWKSQVLLIYYRDCMFIFSLEKNPVLGLNIKWNWI